MSTAYGTACSYSATDTGLVESYSFEFSSLVSSYPFKENKDMRPNRKEVSVELAHSVVLAKHFGVEKLKAIRRYYDGHQVPVGRIGRDAFERLLKQTETPVPDDESMTCAMFESTVAEIPLFPYRMHAVALWDEATNWRVLQASAHEDIWILLWLLDDDERMLDDAPHEIDIFDYCAEWSMEHSGWRGSLGVVMETVRTFLAEWIFTSGQEPVWEPEVPKNCFEICLVETSIVFDPRVRGLSNSKIHRLIWAYQRELQRKVAQTWSKDENLPGNAALIMLFMLSFPCLCMEKVKDAEISAQESQTQVREESELASSNRDCSVDVNVQVWHVRTVLVPQDISLMLRLDLAMHTVSLGLESSSGQERFIWQDWVDAAMGYMRGAEERAGADCGYVRQIVKSDLRNPMLELCLLRFAEDKPDPLSMDENGIEAVVKKTSTWLGWPVFDVKICKFEMDQWLTACDANKNADQKYKEDWRAEYEIAKAEQVIGKIIWSKEEDIEDSTQAIEGRVS